jgi:glucokinase
MSGLASDVVLALDLGGTQIRAAEVAQDGTVRHRRSTSTPVADGAEAIVSACIGILTEVREASARAGAPRALIRGVGISAPGPVDPFRGIVVDPPNLGPAFRDVPVAERVAAALGLPAFLDRDTQVAAFGEGAFGAALGCQDYIYVTVSTGIGGAIVSDGRLLRGPDGSAGEIGHMLVDRTGPQCGCGARGHLEAIASGVAIARAARIAAERGRSATLAELVSATGDAFGAREVVAAAGRGDAVAGEILDDACDAFALSCVSLVDVFDPSLLVVGGSLAAGLGDRLLAPARDAVARLAFRMPARRVRIVPSKLGDDVGLTGASVLVGERLAKPGPASRAPR